ncbi:hypothetical protein V6Z11_A04G160800 [Gossypium hirsutum]
MSMKSVSFSFHLLLLLLLVMHGDGSGTEEMADDLISKGTSVLRLHSMDHDRQTEDDGTTVQSRVDPLSHMDHMDLSVMVFFTLKDLKVGNSMPIYFHSPQAKAMEATLRECESQAIKGETKFCATSSESMLEFASSIFGSNTRFKTLATEHLTKSSTLFQNYTVLTTPEEIPAPMMVACHTVPYPYAVLYCHSQVTENRVFKVSLDGENGDKVTAVAVCHKDTTQWNRNHVSFRVLGIEPGTPGVCHFFPADNFVLVPDP